jgi:phenylalanyl-tRNA synthetase beta subunit
MMLRGLMRTQRAMPLKAVQRRALVGRAEVKAQAVEERARRMGLEVVVEVDEEDHRPMGLQRVVDNLRLRLRRADISSDLSMGRYVGFRISL